MSVAFLLRWQKHLQINFPLIFKSASTSLQKMLPSLPYFLWEQAQHTPSLRLPIFCTSSAEEHRDYSQPPLPSSFHCTALKSRFWKFHMPCLMRLWRMIPSFASVHTTSLCSPFQILPLTLLWCFVCSTALSQSVCSPCLPRPAHKSLGGCSSGFSIRSPDLPGTQPGCRGQVSFPLHTCSLFLSHTREGLSRTLF